MPHRVLVQERKDEVQIPPRGLLEWPGLAEPGIAEIEKGPINTKCSPKQRNICVKKYVRWKSEVERPGLGILADLLLGPFPERRGRPCSPVRFGLCAALEISTNRENATPRGDCDCQHEVRGERAGYSLQPPELAMVTSGDNAAKSSVYAPLMGGYTVSFL